MTLRIAALAIGLGACALRTQGDALHIDAIRPDSVSLVSGGVVEVVLEGRGFAPGTPGRNVVMFGSYELREVPANAEGTRIRMVIPEALPSGSESPPQPIDAGPYQVRVRTSAGESNSATVRVFR